MRRIAEMEEMEKVLVKRIKEAKAAGDKELEQYYWGARVALGWVRDKAGQNTVLLMDDNHKD